MLRGGHGSGMSMGGFAMAFLQSLFGRSPKVERGSSIEGFQVHYDREAFVKAKEAGLWQITDTGISVCSIARSPSPDASSAVGGDRDVIVSLKLKCLRHGEELSVGSVSVFGAPPPSRSFVLPCGCSSQYEIAATDGGPIFAWSYDEISVDDIREDALVPRGLAFPECPNCQHTVSPGSGKQFEILQCLGCGTRYCYACWHKDYVTILCPKCGERPSLEVGLVKAD